MRTLSESIPISTAVIACAIHSIVSAAVDIGIDCDSLLIPTCAHSFCLSSLHPFSLLNVFIMLIICVPMRNRNNEFILEFILREIKMADFER